MLAISTELDAMVKIIKYGDLPLLICSYVVVTCDDPFDSSPICCVQIFMLMQGRFQFIFVTHIMQ